MDSSPFIYRRHFFLQQQLFFQKTWLNKKEAGLARLPLPFLLESKTFSIVIHYHNTSFWEVLF